MGDIEACSKPHFDFSVHGKTSGYTRTNDIATTPTVMSRTSSLTENRIRRNELTLDLHCSDQYTSDRSPRRLTLRIRHSEIFVDDRPTDPEGFRDFYWLQSSFFEFDGSIGIGLCRSLLSTMVTISTTRLRSSDSRRLSLARVLQLHLCDTEQDTGYDPASSFDRSMGMRYVRRPRNDSGVMKTHQEGPIAIRTPLKTPRVAGRVISAEVQRLGALRSIAVDVASGV